MLTRAEEQGVLLPCGNIGYQPVICCTEFSQEAVSRIASLIKRPENAVSASVREKKAVSLLAGVLVCAMAGSEQPLAHHADGSPYIPDHPEVCVTISHCGRAVAAAAATQPVGIDIERIRPRPERVLCRRFSEGEREYVLSRADENEGNAAFFCIWTAKEAAIKASAGLTLSNVFRIDVRPQQGVCVLPDGKEMQVCSVRWQDCVMSLCAEQEIAMPPVLSLTEEQQAVLCRTALQHMT